MCASGVKRFTPQEEGFDSVHQNRGRGSDRLDRSSGSGRGGVDAEISARAAIGISEENGAPVTTASLLVARSYDRGSWPYY